MPLNKETINEVCSYCENHLPNKSWYEERFDFIEDEDFKERIIKEFIGIRFAYKLYEGINASDENLRFEIRNQIFAYASIYEAIIHFVIYEYYSDTEEFHRLTHNNAIAKISIPNDKKDILKDVLKHNDYDILTYCIKERKKDTTSIRFDDKCKTAYKLGLIHNFKNNDGKEIDFVSEIIKIYAYRNAIHLVAEQRKGIKYELDISKLAYRRLLPFIDQIKYKLKIDKKGIYK